MYFTSLHDRENICNRGFTLIELLVVVAIISLLISILMPSLTRAKKLARRALCASNLHQCSVALGMYAISYNGAFPSYGEEILNYPSYTSAIYLNSISESSEPNVIGPAEAFLSYLENYQLLYCPEMFRDHGSPDWPAGSTDWPGYAESQWACSDIRGTNDSITIGYAWAARPAIPWVQNSGVIRPLLDEDSFCGIMDQGNPTRVLAADRAVSSEGRGVGDQLIDGEYWYSWYANHAGINYEPDGVNVLRLDGSSTWTEREKLKRRIKARYSGLPGTDGGCYWW